MNAHEKLRGALVQLHITLVGTPSAAIITGARELIEQVLDETSPVATRVPDSVTKEQDRDIYHATNLARGAIKDVADAVARLRLAAIDVRAGNSETVANITIAYRALEDASMRLGKALQSIDGGVSVYDRSTTVGA